MTHEEIAGLFDTWNEALRTEDPDQVTGLYAPDAVLLPTLSNQVRHNHDEIRDYFVGFLAKQPVGVIEEANTRSLTDNLASNAGVYTFSFGDGTQATARFSYLYRRDEGGWKIIEHHSSGMPEG
ncbi:MAG: SgcJ/EcaC family oxidoreductase [Actinomycetota bacterium]